MAFGAFGALRATRATKAVHAAATRRILAVLVHVRPTLAAHLTVLRRPAKLFLAPILQPYPGRDDGEEGEVTDVVVSTARSCFGAEDATSRASWHSMWAVALPWPPHRVSTSTPCPQTSPRHPLAAPSRWPCMTVPSQKRGMRMARKEESERKMHQNGISATARLANEGNPNEISTDCFTSSLRQPMKTLRSFLPQPVVKSSPSDEHTTPICVGPDVPYAIDSQFTK